MSTNIRRMAEQDLDLLLMLASQSTEAPQWPRVNYEQILGGEDLVMLRCCWVAMRGETLVGFAVTSWVREEIAAEVESLVVDQACRRQGVGSALMGVCMAWAASAGAASIRLETRASNAAALGVYRRRGFAQTGVRPKYYTAPVEDALLLQAPLLVVPQSRG